MMGSKTTSFFSNLHTTYMAACEEPVLPSARADSNDDGPATGPVLLDRKLVAALFAEFLGLVLFQLMGGDAPDSAAAYGNGISLMVLIFATANLSGGHLNPAVTLATVLTGHMYWTRGVLYMIAQIVGGIVGALLNCALLPDVSMGMGNHGPGCFTHLTNRPISIGQLFGWELLMTLLLIMVVYAVAIHKPGFGNIGPLAVGFTLFACAFVGGPMTGAALNPARVLGPSIVYRCYWSTVPVYVIAQYMAGCLAALLCLPVYGAGVYMMAHQQGGDREAGVELTARRAVV